jgi:hypothetical protein
VILREIFGHALGLLARENITSPSAYESGIVASRPSLNLWWHLIGHLDTVPYCRMRGVNAFICRSSPLTSLISAGGAISEAGAARDGSSGIDKGDFTDFRTISYKLSYSYDES